MRRATVMTAIVLSLVATACGSSDSQPSQRRTGERPVTTTTPPPFDGTAFDFAQEFWHSGFRVELTAAEVWTSQTRFTNRTSYWLTLRGDFENLGGEVASFDPDMAVEALGVSYANRHGEPPRILPASPALGELTFLIPEDLDLESAELVVGASGEHQARVPLGSVGDAVRLAPADVAVSGTIAMELIDVDVTSASLGYHLPDLHHQLEAEEVALTLHLDITSRKAGEKRVSMDDLSLVLPDGTVATPAAAELGPVPGGDDGVTTAGQSVSFVVDVLSSGDYTLRFTPGAPFVAEDGITEAEFAFTL